MRDNILILALVFVIIMLSATFAGVSEGQEYASPAWMDNEHIICVKYVDISKRRLFKWFGDITDAAVVGVRHEIQIVSMDVEGNNEKVIKNIIIDRPRLSYKWREEIFKGVLRINSISYSPKKKIVAFSTHGFTRALFIIKEDGIGTEKIAESAGGMAFSPDGRFLEYNSKGKSWLYDLDTGEHKVLIEDALGGPWSPDGEWIYYILQGDHTNNFKKSLNIINVKTGKKLTIEDAGSVNWSLKDSKFTYTVSKKTEQGYTISLYLSKLTDNEIVTVDSVPNASSGLWNPEGDTILFKDSSDNKIYSLNCNTKEKKIVFQPSPEYFHLSEAYKSGKEPRIEKIYPRYWISSDRVIVEADEYVWNDPKTRHSLLVVDVNTSSIIFRYTLEDRISNTLLSPDGKSLIFYDGSKLKALIENGTKVVQLASRVT